jgi:hypothetical protein
MRRHRNTEFFLAWWSTRFVGWFAKNGAQNMVFRWQKCGGTLVKDGQKATLKSALKACHIFQIYFRGFPFWE